ncbi:MAG: Ig-like domain-containing protein [Micrococcales bacterium]|nr:Ig-like domain-containing protein [Micrococcales bacterium]
MKSVSSPHRLGRSLLPVSGLALLCLVGACTGGAGGAEPGPDSAGSSSSSSPTSAAPTPAELTISPAKGATGVLPSQQVTVTADTGELGAVTVKDAAGTALAGTVEGGTWRSTARLKPSARYTVAVKATGPDGTPTTETSTFSTLKPKVTATYGVFYDGETVGVGMPATIQFDSQVATKDLREEVERRVKVTTVPATEGSWGWLDNRQLMWRPKDYWKPGTKVTVSAPLTGVQTGPDKWIDKDHSARFTIGEEVISHVDMKAHTMTVTRGGKVQRVIPVSTGKDEPRFVTRYGTKVIITKEGDVTMDSATVGIPKGDPNYYKLTSHWNLRVTWTGEYLHSAPWSQGSQGVANVSHGCVNMSPGNAEWMFVNSKVGDVVKFTGSSRPFLPTEGIGVWEYSWAGWQKQSALHGLPRADAAPTGEPTTGSPTSGPPGGSASPTSAPSSTAATETSPAA